MMHNDTEKLRR